MNRGRVRAGRGKPRPYKIVEKDAEADYILRTWGAAGCARTWLCLELAGVGGGGFAEGVEFAGATAGVEGTFDGVASDLAAECEDFTGFGAEDDVVIVDSSFEAAGLVGAFEVAGDRVAVLF